MAKDKTQGMQRIDLRIPDHIYSEIERIAIANNLPFSPTTKPNTDGSLKKDKKGNVIQPKVSVSPIILDLINLGLETINQGTADSDKLGDKTRYRGYQLNNQIDVSEIEKKILDTLNQKIEGIVSDKLVSTFTESTELLNTLEAMVETKVREVFEVFSGKELKELTTIEPEIISDIDDNESKIKSFEEAVIEIKRLKEQGLGNTAIARLLTGKFYTKQGKTNWGDTQVRRILTNR